MLLDHGRRYGLFRSSTHGMGVVRMPRGSRWRDARKMVETEVALDWWLPEIEAALSIEVRIENLV